MTKVDLTKLRQRFSPSEHDRRQEEFSMRCAFVMRQYVPVEESTLRNNEPVNSDYRAGKLIWNTPYAAKHYYVPMNHTDPGTTDHWDKACMAKHGKQLNEYAKALYRS